MATITGIHRAPRQLPVALPDGMKLALALTARVTVMFLLAAGYGYLERNLISDVAGLAVITWKIVTSPWSYGLAAIGLLVWKTRFVLLGGPVGAHRG